VFLLPSLCEGSATAIYEALSASLPVICTPNCGSVVRDGVDGIIVPIRNAEAIAEAVLRLADDPALRRQMAENAGQRAAAFDFDSYGRSLLAALEIGKPGREAIIGVGR
jgi:glycosyltransferase involved in cell wall biosynthesis